MAVYFVTGKLGSGKTLVTVGAIKDRLKQNRKVATNLDINVEHIMKLNNKTSITRLPDKPRPVDLTNLGYGSQSVEEETYGLIVLDECGTWLNSRTWNDKERADFVDYMLHARKYGWDVMFIIQDISVVDKQIRLSMCEHLVVCKRLDRLQIPILSAFTKIFGFKVRFPKIHRAIVFYGETTQDLVADKWTYRARDLYPAYDTRQIFKMDTITQGETETDMRSTYCLLPRWHVEGRYHVAKKLPLPRNFHQLLVYPTWLLLQLIGKISKAPSRSGGALRSS
jgi:hypothetical protein